RTLSQNEAALLTGAGLTARLQAKPEKDRTGKDRDTLLTWWLRTFDAPSRDLTQQRVALEEEDLTLRRRSPVTLVMQEKPNSMPKARILSRGQYDQPKEEVTPDTPAALHPFPKNAPRNRLGLAEWLIAPENPLTARVTVNRFWQEAFGTGIVKTSEDF